MREQQSQTNAARNSSGARVTLYSQPGGEEERQVTGLEGFPLVVVVVVVCTVGKRSRRWVEEVEEAAEGLPEAAERRLRHRPKT